MEDVTESTQRMVTMIADSLAYVAALRERLGAIAGTLDSLSDDTREALLQLGSTDISSERFERALERLRPDDLTRLEYYVKARVRIARRGPKLVLAKIRAAGDSVWRLVRAGL